ncbi:MAG: O-antigen ligase family protein [Rhodospirillales bacterium]|nr:O-antigen ligase family protein [Rhodospirillales bacterium]
MRPDTARLESGYPAPVLFLVALAFLPVFATLAPRAMVFLPGLIGLVFCAAACLRGPSHRIFSRTLWALILAPVLLGGLSALWSADPAQALERTAKVTATLLTGALLIPAARRISRETLSEWGWLLPGAVACSSLVIALDLIAGLPLHRLAAGVEANVPFDPFHANRGVVVATLLFFPALGFAWFITRQRMKIFLCGGLFVSAGLMLFACESQSAQMAFFCGLAALAIFPLFQTRVGKTALWALISTGIFAAPWVAMAVFAPLAGAIDAHESLREMSAPQRLEIWDFIARKIMERPFFGFGIDATRDMAFDTAELYHKGNTILHPHDVALQIWIEFGAFGVVCAVVFLAGLIRSIMALPPRTARFAFGGFAASLSIAATGYGMWQGWWLGTILALAGWSVLLASQDFSQSKPSDSSET